MDELASWTRTTSSFGGETREVYRKGSGTGVIVLHEVPGLSADVVAFAEQVVARGHTVLLPRLFGQLGGFSLAAAADDLRRFCIRREFAVFARGRTSPIVVWLRALARELHDERPGSPGVGVVGMCFTGGFALAMLADGAVIAPVLAEPSLPFPVGIRPGHAAARGADLGLSPADLTAARDSSCEVLGLRFRRDWMSGTRFTALERELGDRFIGVEFEGPGHSVLTRDRRGSGVRDVLDFLDATLDGSDPAPLERDAEREAAAMAELSAFPVVEAVVTRQGYELEVIVDRPLTDDEFTRLGIVAHDRLGVRPDVRLRR